jgi:dethiobiotin synthetase
MSTKWFITGIGTDVGKTVVSSILAEALGATYWKPVQAGDLHFSDSMKVKSYCSEKVQVLPERYRLNTPASPHYAAQLDQVTIELSDFSLPEVEGNLLIEGAGGLLVPINQKGLLYIDVIKHFNLPVVLVSRNYLGSINHSLLSIEALKSRNIQVDLLVFSGERNEASEEIIQRQLPGVQTIYIPFTSNVDAEFVAQQAEIIRTEIQ